MEYHCANRLNSNSLFLHTLYQYIKVFRRAGLGVRIVYAGYTKKAVTNVRNRFIFNVDQIGLEPMTSRL